MNDDTKSSGNADRSTLPGQASSSTDNRSLAERYAASQASADGIQGDVKKPNKTEAEKIAAQMADMK